MNRYRRTLCEVFISLYLEYDFTKRRKDLDFETGPFVDWRKVSTPAWEIRSTVASSLSRSIDQIRGQGQRLSYKGRYPFFKHNIRHLWTANWGHAIRSPRPIHTAIFSSRFPTARSLSIVSEAKFTIHVIFVGRNWCYRSVRCVHVCRAGDSLTSSGVKAYSSSGGLPRLNLTHGPRLLLLIIIIISVWWFTVCLDAKNRLFLDSVLSKRNIILFWFVSMWVVYLHMAV